MRIRKRKAWGRGRILFPLSTLVIGIGVYALYAAPAENEGARHFRTIYPPPPESGVMNLWRFDEELGLRSAAPDPLFSDNVSLFESWSGNAVSLFGTDRAFLRFPESDAGGRVHLNTVEGSIRFWFRPHWGSSQLGGSGPGSYARLIEMGAADRKARTGWWSLYLNPEGNAIYFSAQGRGRSIDYLAAPVAWEPGQWHEVALTYSAEATALYLDGVIAARGGGISLVPDSEIRREFGFALGSDAAGGSLAQGEFDELTTYHGVLDAEEVARVYRVRAMQVWRDAMDGAGLLASEQSSTDGGISLMSDAPEPPGGGGGGGGGSGGTNSPAYNYAPGTFYIEMLSATNGLATVQLHNTQPDTMYELLSETVLTNSSWPGEQFVLGAPGATSTVAVVPFLDRTNELFLQARSWQDSDGDGLPDWWEAENGLDPDEPDTGNSGVSDGYKDADGDGWTNLQEFQNATSPVVFNTPPPPNGVSAAYGSSPGSVVVSWNKALGTVTGYTIVRYWDGINATSVVSSATLSYADTLPAPVLWEDYRDPTYWVRANYSSASSDWSAPVSPAERVGGIHADVVRGPGGKPVLVVSGPPPGTTALKLWRETSDSSGFVSITNFIVALSSFIDGRFSLPTNWAPQLDYGFEHRWKVQPVDASGRPGLYSLAGGTPQVPFFDGREHLKQNLAFHLRAANKVVPFTYTRHYSSYDVPRVGSTNYAYSGFIDPGEWLGFPFADLDEWRPFEDNYTYRNLVFDPGSLTAGGHLNTGVYGSINDGLSIPFPCTHEFWLPTAEGPVPTQLSPTVSQWFYYDPYETGDGVGRVAITKQGSNWTLAANDYNLFGLSYHSVKLASPSGIFTLLAGGSVPGYASVLYPQTAQPELQTVGYLFGRLNQDFLPGHDSFANTNTTPLLVTGIGDRSFRLGGYAKQAILNGSTTQFGYLGQYFDKAYRRGTTNETGVLSPYGEFFATEPGPVELVTMPDPDTGQRGTGVVHVIKLQLDVNHDGVMDLSWSGPDNANTYDRPFRFWVNDDHDAPASGSLPDRDVPINKRAYSVADGVWGEIKSQRNLEDFARFWIRGIPALKSTDGYEVKLEIWPWEGNPHLRLYRAFETDGGIGYLTSTNVAAGQLSQTNTGTGLIEYGKDVWHLSDTTPYNLPLLPNGGLAISNFIFEASGAGIGTLALSIWRNGGLIAEHRQEVDFRDIGEMYEQILVTDVTQRWPEMVEDNRTSAYSIVWTPESISQETAETFVLVHGWRMALWDYASFSATMFKRLYWQGFQGRFASLRWPTRSEDSDLPYLDYITYNRSEHIAFKSAAGTAAYLNDLRNRFPQHRISVAAHSMGNIVMMETLKQLAAANQRPIDNYVMMQAAVPAHSFDPSVTNLPLFTQAEANVPTPNTYHDYASGVTNALRELGTIANFFNVDDAALNAWRLNQSWGALGSAPWEPTMKPNTYLGYYTNGTGGLLRTNEYNITLASALYGGFYYGHPTRTVDAPIELMPFVSRPRSQPVGAQGGLSGQILLEQDLKAQFGFGDHKDDHSGQFNWNIQRLDGFYFNLRQSMFPGSP